MKVQNKEAKGGNATTRTGLCSFKSIGESNTVVSAYTTVLLSPIEILYIKLAHTEHAILS